MTVSETQTPVCSPTVPAPTCTLSPPVYVGHKYRLFYSGYGYVENTLSPGNPNNASPAIFVLPNNQDISKIATMCASYANTGPIFGGIDLHFRISTNQWECLLYGNSNTDPSYFNVADPDVGCSFGYYQPNL